MGYPGAPHRPNADHLSPDRFNPDDFSPDHFSPDHFSTVELPCERPDLASIVASTLLDPEGRRTELTEHLSGRGGSGHLTATGWVLAPDLDRILLVRHRTLGWSCPGGHVEGHETPAAAATRELAEETGIVAEPARPEPVLLHVARFERPPPHVHWGLGHLFLVVPEDDRLVPEAGSPARWFPVAASPQNAPADLAQHLPLILTLAGRAQGA